MERQHGLGFDTKAWACEKCGYRRSLYQKEDFDAWEEVFAGQMKNRPDEPKGSDYNKFYSLIEKPVRTFNKEPITSKGCNCGGNCKCSSKPSGGCGSCGGCK